MVQKVENERLNIKRPKVKMVGMDGNAFSILGRCLRAAVKAGWSQQQRDDFRRSATAGDYSHLLATVMNYFDVR